MIQELIPFRDSNQHENVVSQDNIQNAKLSKQSEADILQTERLAITGKIARAIAHEVRNPLTSLNLALDQLLEEIPTQNTTAKIYCDIIGRSARRIELLVDELLNSSKTQQLSLALYTIEEIINGAVSLALDRLKLNHIQLHINCGENLPPILVDKEKIQIALLNIIINAIEAMVPEEGVLRIESTMKEKVITITISDNGKGIAEADRDKLFDPFFTKKQSGVGLGLTSTKNILNVHSAQIHVKSELNIGTTFYVNFNIG